MKSQLYETDFYAWTLEQVQLLKQGQTNQIDVLNLIEEIESLGKREKQELRNRLGILIGHLLKWQYQNDKRSNSWKATIREQRRRIKEHLEENPSLKSYLSEAMISAYQDGIDLAIQETNLPDRIFPGENPYSISQILDPDFLVNQD
ncbi:MAG: DUF29 domain-containing protein [Cuspidothrix sp.]